LHKKMELYKTPKDLPRLSELPLEKYDAAKNVTVVPVMVGAGPYADHIEARLRARKAVLEGLSRASYFPEDPEHIHHALFQRPWPDGDELFISVPYEWLKNAASDKRVVILWLQEQDLSGRPIGKLCSLLESLGWKGQAIRLIGPRSSTALTE